MRADFLPTYRRSCSAAMRSGGGAGVWVPAFLCAALLWGVPGAAAQAPASAKPVASLKRPALPAGADSVDPAVLMTYANRVLSANAEDARRAYFWAARYDPTSADALMGQWTALMLSDPKARTAFVERRQDGAARGVDSLRQLATLRDPFVGSPFLLEILRREVRDANPHLPEAELLAQFDDLMAASRNPFIQAMVAEQQGRVLQALNAWGEAAKLVKGDWTIRLSRARIFRALDGRDSAMAELRRAIADRPGADAQAKGKTVLLFLPMAMLHHAMGILHEEAGAESAARDAYGQAIAEDASFWPAQVRLAVLASARGDTSAALAGLQLAAETSPLEVLPRFQLALAQVAAGNASGALASLKQVVSLEPYFALPYLLMARLYDYAEYTDEAMAAYDAFVARAPAGADRDAAAARRKALADQQAKPPAP